MSGDPMRGRTGSRRDAAGVGREAARGVAWAFVATIATRLVTLLSLAVLARVLAPADFGLLAFALVFLTYLDVIGDLGTGAALIYWPDRQEDVAQLTFIVSMITGLAWMALTLALAPAVADFFDSPNGTPVLRALALSFPLRALGNTHDALLQRELRFRARALPELAQSAGKAAIAIPLALTGFGVWSLVWGQIGGLALWAGLLWIVSPWRPSWHLPRGLGAPVFRYGRGVVAVNVVAAVVHHIDFVIVGRVLGTVALGFYQIAYRIPDVILTLVVRVTGKVLFPAFSRIHGAGTALRSGYLTALRMLSLLTLPAVAALVILAEPLVLTAFGSQWRPSIPLLQAFAVYVGLRATGSYAGDVLKATGRAGLLARLGVVKAALLVPALLIAAPAGLVPVALTLAGVTFLTTLLNLGAIVVIAAVPPAAILTALGPGAAAAAGFAAGALPASLLARALPAPLQLAIAAPAGLILAWAFARALAPASLRDVYGILRGLRDRGSRDSGPLPVTEDAQ